MFWDESVGFIISGESKRGTAEGFNQYDAALSGASWSVHDDFTGGSMFGVPNTQGFSWEGEVAETKAEFKNKEQATKIVKKAAKFWEPI